MGKRISSRCDFSTAQLFFVSSQPCRQRLISAPLRYVRSHGTSAGMRSVCTELRQVAASITRSSPGTNMALFAMGLGVLVIANDFTALNVALPAIEQDFDVDVGTVQWTVNAYALTYGMVLVTGGRLADMFGRRK